ncbi:MAG: hypothetical protein ACI4N3_04540 [Alphaproteobacteria bacterium]
MENFESSLPENLQKQLELGVNDIYKKFDDILHDENLSNDEKNKQIDDLINQNDATKAYFSGLKNLANDYLDLKYSTPLKNEDDYKKDLEKISLQSTNDLKKFVEDCFATKAKKDDMEKAKSALKELGVAEETLNNLNSYQIEEIINELEHPSAGVEEQIDVLLEDLNLPKKDADRIKKQYQYKVEGKITSGLSELDDFLGIIQPGLDLILKTGAKLFYEGIVDNVEKAFLGNKEQGVKSDFEVWAERKKNLKSDYDFLHTYGKLPKTDTFKYSKNTDKDENHVATYFHQMIIDKINENRRNAKDENGNPKPFEDFKGNPFDETKDIEETQKALQEIIKDVIRASREEDANKKHIAKPTDKGKKDLETIGHLLDLFNKKNSPEFKAQFSNMAEYYKSGYTEKYSGKFIEDSDYYAKEEEEKLKEEQMNTLINALGGQEAFNAKLGNSK